MDPRERNHAEERRVNVISSGERGRLKRANRLAEEAPREAYGAINPAVHSILDLIGCMDRPNCRTSNGDPVSLRVS